jgi:glycosyltransferase involved in cell wall biosynthesis
MSSEPMRVAINLLTDDPAHPSGAHWFWTRVIPEMAARLEDGEELHLMVSPRSRESHQGYGPGVRYLAFPWSNERQRLRVLSEQLYAPARLRSARIDVLNTLIAPLMRPAPSIVAHFKTMHAFTAPAALSPIVRAYRRASYPHTAKVADAIIINSESLRTEVLTYLDVDPGKLRLVPEAVDHSTFRPGDPAEARAHVARYGIDRPFILFVSSLWPYKNLHGLMRAFALARPHLDGHQLAVVGPGRDVEYVESLHALARELGIADVVVWVGGVPLEETVQFYRAAAAFAYPSFSETFGLPILEAMACGCPVVTSDRSAMAETAGGAALLADPEGPESLADALVGACGREGDVLRPSGLARAAEFSWARTGELTLDVYREVHRAGEKVRA